MRHPRYPYHVLRRPLSLLRPRARQEKRPRRERAVWSTVRPRALPIVPSTQSAVPQYIARWTSTEWACTFSRMGLQKRGGDQGTVGPPRVLCLRYQYMHQPDNAPLPLRTTQCGPPNNRSCRLGCCRNPLRKFSTMATIVPPPVRATSLEGMAVCIVIFIRVFVIKKRGCLSIETTIFREYQSRRDQRPTSKVL